MLGLSLALLTTACAGFDIDVSLSEEGSGVRSEETLDLDLSDVDSVEASGVWDVAIEVVDAAAGQDSTITIVLDDNFVDYTDIKVDGSALHIGFNRGNIDPDITPTATVTLSSLAKLEADGATSVAVRGNVSNLASIDVSGASSVEVVSLEVDALDIDIDGASDLFITGTATSGTIDMNGASSSNLSGLTWTTVDIDVNGSGDLLLTATGSVSGKAEGASDVVIEGGAAVSVSSSGASDVESN